MFDALRGNLKTLSDERLGLTVNKLREMGASQETSLGSYSEAVARFRTDRDLMRATLDEGIPLGVPLITFRTLERGSTDIAKTVNNILNGNNQVEDLVVQLENFHYQAWLANLDKNAKRFLVYQSKLDEISSLQLRMQAALDELSNATQVLEEVKNKSSKADSLLDAIRKISSNINGEAAEIKNKLGESQSALSEIKGHLGTIQQSQKTAIQQASVVTQHAGDVDARRKAIEEFQVSISKTRETTNKIVSDAQSSVANNSKETSDLVERLKSVEVDIKDKLQKATGVSLFHSFGQRQISVQWAKRFWGMIIAAIFFLSIGLSVYLVNTHNDALTVTFFLKLSLAIPLVFAMWFSTRQYVKERRLEEEYAFKSRLSISLTPYIDLVEKLVKTDDKENLARYRDFIIESINKIFTPPPESIFQKPQSDGWFEGRKLKRVEKFMESVAKVVGAAKP